jgi:hypothetical protein
VDVDLLSDDQRLLMEYMFGITEGKVPEKFVYRKPGPLNHARWLTTAIRILVLYTRTEKPSETLKVLVNYIVKVYGFNWFVVRESNNFTAGPDILYDMIQGVKEVQNTSKLEQSITEIVFKVLERNAFCCLGENFLASLLFSSNEEYRQTAVAKILDIRACPTSVLTPTSIPAINFDAEEWGKLVDVSSLQCHEPPCVRNISNEKLKEMVASQHQPPPFPLHSQSVERAVKLTTEASTTSYIWQKRHNYIVAKSKSRAGRPEFRTKKDYV